ncbi:MAG: ATPase domain-containing protein [Candidatus Thermoplasmatota archaeon]|jgi:circadian clock protein KaiC|nr:ATPase domain-containing protein [Candidatus Thermoplasmatota archaeon]
MNGITKFNNYSVEKIQRLKTGVEGLDKLIEGGLPKNSITLISGPPGGGKSIFCFQFLYEGVKNGEKCLFLTLDKQVEGILIQAKNLGFDFQPAIEKNIAKFLYLNIAKKFVYEAMTNEILSGQYSRIVLDSITPLSEMPIFIRNTEDIGLNNDILDIENVPEGLSLPTRRLHLRFIMSALESSKSTAVVTSELPVGSSLLSRDGISEFIADGVITLSYDPTMDRRKLSIIKMRNTKHSLKPHDIIIDNGGIKVL